MKNLVNRFLRFFLGYEIIKAHRFAHDASYSPVEKEIYTLCKSRTMTNPNSISNLISATDYLTKAKIEGAYVECGVWRGGSSMAFCLATLRNDLDRREVFLYDTFEGYLGTSKEDFQIQDKKTPSELYRKDKNYLCYAGLEDVKFGIDSTGYPNELLHYVIGDVQKTIPKTLPKSIALLRLDTDYFESTMHELTYLYPLLSPGGVVIIDDYDHWNGSRQACDSYFHKLEENILLIRMESGRMFIKKGLE